MNLLIRSKEASIKQINATFAKDIHNIDKLITKNHQIQQHSHSNPHVQRHQLQGQQQNVPLLHQVMVNQPSATRATTNNNVMNAISNDAISQLLVNQLSNEQILQLFQQSITNNGQSSMYMQE